MARSLSWVNGHFLLIFCFVSLSTCCLPASAVSAAHIIPSQSNRELLSSVHQCRSIRHIPISEQCSFSQRNCADEDDGILSYFSLYYCRLATAQPLALIVLLAWSAFLFSGLGIVAGVFLAVNLSTVARDLHMSDTLAGVTFLALGNGAPDIFSTVAAMNKSSNNLAIGELIGAAAFITSVIPGSMALIRPFDVVKVSLVRDALFLLTTITLLLFILYGGYLRLWHCVVLLAIYVIYIAVVAGWHWWQSRQHGELEENFVDTGSTNDSQVSPAVHETDPLLSRDHLDQNNGSTRDSIRSQHHHTAADFSRWDEETRDVPDAQVLDFRYISGKASSSLHTRHWAQGRTVQNPNVARRRHRDDDVDTNTHSRFKAATLGSRSASKSGNILLRSISALVRTDNGEGRFGTLLIAAHVVMLPLRLVLNATIPRIQEDGSDARDSEEHQNGAAVQDNDHAESQNSFWNRWLILIQCFTAPQFMLWIVSRQLSKTASQMFISSMICLGVSAVLAIFIYLTGLCSPGSRWHRLLCIPGFIVSIGWISLIADEIVAVLKILGTISGVPDGIMGITLFAIGNSIDDWAANISVARHEHPVMALGACFGGPLLNILLGLSISGISVIVKATKANHRLTAIELNASRSLFFVAGATILNIGLLLALMVWTKWKMTRFAGFTLTCFWVGCTLVNVVLEIK